MRFTTVISVLLASLAAISPSYSSPIPSQLDSAGTKRDSLHISRQATNTGADSTGVQGLVSVLIKALQTFQDQNTPSGSGSGSNSSNTPSDPASNTPADPTSSTPVNTASDTPSGNGSNTASHPASNTANNEPVEDAPAESDC